MISVRIQNLQREIDKAYSNKRSIYLIEKLERQRDDLIEHTCYVCMNRLAIRDTGLCNECKKDKWR